MEENSDKKKITVWWLLLDRQRTFAVIQKFCLQCMLEEHNQRLFLMIAIQSDDPNERKRFKPNRENYHSKKKRRNWYLKKV